MVHQVFPPKTNEVDLQSYEGKFSAPSWNFHPTKYLLRMSIPILVIFPAAYLLITLENAVRINKAAFALLTGVVCWGIYWVGEGVSTPLRGSLAIKLLGT